MTQNQLRFQQNMEERRHNRETERLGTREAATHETQAQASMISAGAAAQQAAVAGRRADIEQQKADTSRRQGRAKLIIEGVDTGIQAVGKLAKSAATIS